MDRTRNAKRLLPLATVAMFSAGAAHAEGPPALTPSDNIIQEVLVTARKRSENLQDVPASIVAVSRRQIDSLNAKLLTDLNRVTPNAHIGDDGTITIRGISSIARNVGFEAGAAVYIDGVYQGRPLGNNQDLVDADRVEVLRGPQGTLYGKNTTAGAINVVTVRPGAQLTGRAEIQYGDGNDQRYSGYVAGPLAEDLVGFKLAAFRRKFDGFQTNLFNGEKYGSLDTAGGRFELRITPGSWDLALRGDLNHDDSQPEVGKAVAGFASSLAPGFDQVNQNVDAGLSVHSKGASFTAQRDFVKGHHFTSISSWRALRARQTADDDNSPFDIAHHTFTDRGHQWSEELRLASPLGPPLTYVVGAYAFGQTLDSNRPVTLGALFPIHGTLTDLVTVEARAYALFGNADYGFTDRLGVNLGLRYTNERKTLEFVQTGLPLLGYPDFNITDAFEDSDISPTAGVTFKINPDVTTYAKVSKGFKSGGWNPDITTTSHIKFDAEEVTNYEAGLRTRLLGDRLIANVTAYYMDYRNLQVSQFIGTFSGFVITNAGAATIKGAELDLQALPATWLNLSGGLAYNDATYDKFDSGTGASYAGQQFTNTPRLSGFVAFDARWPVLETGDLVAQGDYRVQDEVFFDDQRTVTVVGPAASGSYGTVNARIGIIMRSGFEAFVFGDNLSDKRVLVGRLVDGLGLGLTIDRYGPPRQFGVRVGYKF